MLSGTLYTFILSVKSLERKYSVVCACAICVWFLVKWTSKKVTGGTRNLFSYGKIHKYLAQSGDGQEGSVLASHDLIHRHNILLGDATIDVGKLGQTSGVVGGGVANIGGELVLHLAVQLSRVDADADPVTFHALVEIVSARDEIDRISTGMSEAIGIVRGREVSRSIPGGLLELSSITHVIDHSWGTIG